MPTLLHHYRSFPDEICIVPAIAQCIHVPGRKPAKQSPFVCSRPKEQIARLSQQLVGPPSRFGRIDHCPFGSPSSECREPTRRRRKINQSRLSNASARWILVITKGLIGHAEAIAEAVGRRTMRFVPVIRLQSLAFGKIFTRRRPASSTHL